MSKLIVDVLFSDSDLIKLTISLTLIRRGRIEIKSTQRTFSVPYEVIKDAVAEVASNLFSS